MGFVGGAVPGIPGVEAYAAHGEGSLRIVVIPGAPTPASAEVVAAWEAMGAANPRLYNGPVLSVVSIDLERAEITCRRDEFRRLAVQPRVRTGVRVLSVTGVVTSRDASGREHVLLGRRGVSTRVYPGLWELGPAGGIPVPAPTIRELDERAIREQVLAEAAEEVGIALRPGPIVALARDWIACSDDIVVRCEADGVGSVGSPGSPWEYDETRWVPVVEVPAFDREHAAGIIGPTRALFRVLGWIAGT